MAQSISNLPIGAKIHFGKHQIGSETPLPITWIIVDKNHYGRNEITLLAEKIIDFRPIDGKEPTNTDEMRQEFGNNRYDVSNISQWLNSDGEAYTWFTPQHPMDDAPVVENTRGGTHYLERPGFLYNFTEDERNILVSAPIVSALPDIDGGGTVTMYPKLFLPSAYEVDNTYTLAREEGTMWEYFNNTSDKKSARQVGATYQAIIRTQSSSKPADTSDYYSWWLRTPIVSSSSHCAHVSNTGNFNDNNTASTGIVGLRPAANISSMCLVSDTTDSNGVYSIVDYNITPLPPSGLTLTQGEQYVYFDKDVVLGWNESPSSNVSHYEVELRNVLGEWEVIQTVPKNNKIHYEDNLTHASIRIPIGSRHDGAEVYIAVRAVSVTGVIGTRDILTSIVTYYRPHIYPEWNVSDVEGVKTSEFSLSYYLVNETGVETTVSVGVGLDHFKTIIDTYTITLSADPTNKVEKIISIVGEDWLKLHNTDHTILIGIGLQEFEIPFTKKVDTLVVGNTEPMVSASKPSRISVDVIYGKPANSILKVEVCNNGYDTEPTWEDMTYAVEGKTAYVFTNTENTSGKWGVKIRASIDRNNAVGECYISSIGGNFE